MTRSAEIELLDEDTLLRRRAPDHVSGERFNSLAFSKEDPFEKSVNLARMTTIEETLGARPRFGIGEISVSDVRDLGLEVVYDPVPGNADHCLIVGPYSKAIARSLAAHTRIIVFPS